MNDQSTFENRVAALLRGYADQAPIEVDATGLAHGIAVARQRRWTFPALSPAFVLAIGLLLATVLTIVAAALLVELQPAPSGRNGLIAFAVNDLDTEPYFHLHVMNPDGTDEHEVGQGSEPRYSADGSALLFFTGWGFRADVDTPATNQMAKPDGSEPVQIPGVAQGSSVVSPDGKSILRIINDAPELLGARSSAHLVQTFVADGSSRVIIDKPSDPGLFWGEPVWSPDGRSVALPVMRDFETASETGAYREAIDIVNIETGESNRLTTRRGSYQPGISWSPSNDALVFTAWPDSSALPSLGAAEDTLFRPDDLFVVRLDETSEVNLTNSAAHNTQPAWAPDGRSILFLTSAETTTRVSSVPMSGLTSSGSIVLGPAADEAIWAPDSQAILYSLEDRIWSTDTKFAAPPQILYDGIGVVRSLTWQWLAP